MIATAACVVLFDGWRDLISVPTLPPSILYIHNTTEMVAMLDGGNGGAKPPKKTYVGWGLGRINYIHGRYTPHIISFSGI